MYWLLGGTGSGKTYTAISRASELGEFAYVSPTRLLAIETYEKYGKINDSLNVGTVYIPGNGNFFGTYGQLKIEKIKKYKTIIIDEAHYIDGDFLNHRKKIRSIIKTAEAEGVEVIAVTATPPHNIKKYEVEILPAAKMPAKRRVSYERAMSRAAAGVKTILMCSAIKTAESYYFNDRLTGDWCIPEHKIARAWRGMKEADIYKEFLRFKEGDASVLICSNIAQQGVNLPCENLICLTRKCDAMTDMVQKLGRLGRPFMTQPDAGLTWYDDYHETLKEDCEEEEEKEEWDGTVPPVRENPRYTEEGDKELTEDCDGYREEIDHELTQFLRERRDARHGRTTEPSGENVLFSFQDEDNIEFLGYSGRRGGAMYRNKTGRIRVAA